MERIEDTFTRALQSFRPSLLLGLYMVAIFAAMRISQGGRLPVVEFAAERVYVDTGFWESSLLLGIFLIMTFRPGPFWAFICSTPMLGYGGFAAQYALATGAIDWTVAVLMLGGYIGTLVLVGVASVLANVQRDCAEKSRLLEKAEMTLKHYQEKEHLATGAAPTSVPA